MSTSAGEVIERLYRAEYGRILSVLLRDRCDFELAEDALADAFSAALESWSRTGLPDRPAAWITVAARRRRIDLLRRRAREQTALAAAETDPDTRSSACDAEPVMDERLRLIFTCCHPALAEEARVALTLNAVCGFTAAEIARAFLLGADAMAQRMVRAKRKIRDAGIPYEVPTTSELPVRLSSVLTVLYLVFSAGHTAGRGASLTDADWCDEAIRLGRLLVGALPGEPEAHGLLALMLLQDSRRAARLADDGTLVRLADQDRRRWDRTAIREGLRHLGLAALSQRPGPRQLEAAIAAEHAIAARAADVAWPRILAHYDRLVALAPTPVIELNRAVALAEVAGAAVALTEVDRLMADGALDGYPYLHATRAELLERLGRRADAAGAWRRAADLTANDTERRFLADRARAAAQDVT